MDLRGFLKYFKCAQVCAFAIKSQSHSEPFMDCGRILPDFGVVPIEQATIFFPTVDGRKVSKVWLVWR